MRNIYFNYAINQIPKILTLMDRNKHSPTYGCFDRNYWHYKIIDFPSGMSQEFVLPLALAYKLKNPENPYYKNKSIKDFVISGINFAIKSSHKDGSCDDYYPFEKAAGATAFSLLACIYSYKLLEIKEKDFEKFFEKRANWLIKNTESGRLSNHEALIILSSILTSRIIKTSKWNKDIELRLDRLLSWQNEEGWFQEYEGCDLGYQTLTISFLAWIYDINPNEKIKKSLSRAFDFISNFIHPDGSFGGEYGSRNTYCL